MPDLVDMGWNHIRDGDYDAALHCFHLAVLLDGGSARAHLACAEALLATGDYLPGWREFTWRRQHNKVTAGFTADLRAPEWNGRRMPKGRLLVLCDEGLGDAIMFARYLPLVAERCAEVIMGWGGEYQPLLEGVPGITRICASKSELPHHYDAWCLICDLPNLFATTAETVPPTPYMQPDPQAVERWRPVLDGALPKGQRRVGLVWSGSSGHGNDGNRSLKLEQLTPVLNVPGCTFVSLQKEVRDADRLMLSAQSNLLDLSDRLRDFRDTKAVISQLDLVISVDSSPAHLAGAMGKPVWVLMPRPADWRWRVDGETTPWYASMRLFRQPRPKQWDPAIEAITGALRDWAGKG